MLKINFMGHDIELVKSKYMDNERLAILMIDDGYIIESLTVNIPECTLMSEYIGEGYESFINQIDGVSYDYTIDWLEENNLSDDIGLSRATSGFNNYLSAFFNEDTLDQMRNLEEVK